MIHLATLRPKPDMAPNRAAIVGMRQTTARNPSQLKKKAITLAEINTTWPLSQRVKAVHLQGHQKCTIGADVHVRARREPSGDRRLSGLTRGLKGKGGGDVGIGKRGKTYLLVATVAVQVEIDHLQRRYVRVMWHVIHATHFARIDQTVGWRRFDHGHGGGIAG